MKKVTFFITSMSSGGAEHQMAELTKLLVKEMYEVTIVTFADVSDHYILDSKVKRVTLAKGKNSFIKLLTIFKFFLFLKTDCIISFGQRENLLVLIPLIFRPSVKVIAGERNFTYGKQDKIERILFNVFYKRANYIVPNSFSQRNYIINLKPQYKDKVITITNYTDISQYSPNLYKSNSKVNIGIFCRYAKQKNYERFVEAIKIVKQKTNIPFIVNWYGNKTFKDSMINPCYSHFEQLVAKAGITDVINLNGHIQNVDEVMRQLDVFCLPSLFEGFSNSLSEAICCGLPVVASNVSDNSVMVHDGKNGFLFNPHYPEQIADSILKFLNLSDLDKKEMAEKSRDIALSLFDKKKFVNSYIDLINN